MSVHRSYTTTASRQLQTPSTAAARRQAWPALSPASDAAMCVAAAARASLPATLFASRRPHTAHTCGTPCEEISDSTYAFGDVIFGAGIREGTQPVTGKQIWRSEAAEKPSYDVRKVRTCCASLLLLRASLTAARVIGHTGTAAGVERERLTREARARASEAIGGHSRRVQGGRAGQCLRSSCRRPRRDRSRCTERARAHPHCFTATPEDAVRRMPSIFARASTPLKSCAGRAAPLLSF